MSGRAPSDVVNICFHGVGTPSSGLEPEAVNYFVGTDLFLAVLDEIAERPGIGLSFDDGYASDVAIALPAIAERGMSAHFFPLAGRLGKPGHVNRGGVRALAEGGMTIGSHGMRHRAWRGMDAAAQQEELVTARALLADAAGTPVDTVACPFGAYDRELLAALHHHGYAQVFTSDRNRARAGAWLQPRYSVLNGDTVESVRRNVLEPRPLAERLRGAAAARIKAWR